MQTETVVHTSPRGWSTPLPALDSEETLVLRPNLAIAISCVGRRLVLGQRAEEEVEAAKEALPEGAHLIGFYSYGEMSPYSTGPCDLHNQTMTLTNLQEH